MSLEPEPHIAVSLFIAIEIFNAMRYVQIAATFLFLACCAVQFNDPDPLLWIAVYGYAALLSGLAAFGIHTPLPIPGLVLYIAGFLYLSPNAGAGWFASEEGREAYGLLLAALWMCVLLVQWRRSVRTRALSPV